MEVLSPSVNVRSIWQGKGLKFDQQLVKLYTCLVYKRAKYTFEDLSSAKICLPLVDRGSTFLVMMFIVKFSVIWLHTTSTGSLVLFLTGMAYHLGRGAFYGITFCFVNAFYNHLDIHWFNDMLRFNWVLNFPKLACHRYDILWSTWDVCLYGNNVDTSCIELNNYMSCIILLCRFVMGSYQTFKNCNIIFLFTTLLYRS